MRSTTAGRTILVTGATGKVGSETVRLLAAQHAPVRALVRDAGRARALAEAGAELAVGDFEQPSTLTAAMDGVATVVLVSPGGPPEQEMAVVHAAAAAGVTHVVKATSKADPDSPVARQRWHAQVEAGLTTSGIAHTLLRSNAYMQNTLMLARGVAASSGFASSAGQGRIGMVDSRDVAAVAATIAAAPQDHAGQVYWLSGSELVTYADVAAALTRLLGRTITFTARSRQEDEAELVAAGLPAPAAAMNALALSTFADGDAQWLSDDVPDLLGRPARTFEQFLADHADAFS